MPCLHLSGVGVDATGKVFASEGSPTFLLFGLTLNATASLFKSAGVFYMDDYLKKGMEERRRRVNVYNAYATYREELAQAYQEYAKKVSGFFVVNPPFWRSRM